jgi:nitrogen fixation NifU-like protein
MPDASVTGLYEDVVLDHAKQPRNRGPLPQATHAAAADNPLCGDTVRVELEVGDDGIRAASFEGHACAIVTASASLMTEHVRGRTARDAHALVERMETLCAGPTDASAVAGAALGELAVFAGVRRYPARVRCATLPWHALRLALAD